VQREKLSLCTRHRNGPKVKRRGAGEARRLSFGAREETVTRWWKGEKKSSEEVTKKRSRSSGTVLRNGRAGKRSKDDRHQKGVSTNVTSTAAAPVQVSGLDVPFKVIGRERERSQGSEEAKEGEAKHIPERNEPTHVASGFTEFGGGRRSQHQKEDRLQGLSSEACRAIMRGRLKQGTVQGRERRSKGKAAR